MNRRFVKKPIEIEAFRYCFDPMPEWCMTDKTVNQAETNNDMWLEIETLEGVMRANPGDFVIKGIKGEIYPCKSDIFLASYEEVNCPYVVAGDLPLDDKIWSQPRSIIPVQCFGIDMDELETDKSV